MKQFITLSLLLACCAICGHTQTEFTQGRHLVGSCPRPDTSMVAVLIANSFDLADSSTRPLVSVFEMNIVCESPGLMRDTISSFSTVAHYSCSGEIAECTGTPLTNQFQYDCNEDDTFTMAQILGGTLITRNQTASLTTLLDDQCGLCVDPDSGMLPSDTVNHCAGQSSH